jgi:uncharacterized protein YdhG (YjbR/CyaY superfamily)
MNKNSVDTYISRFPEPIRRRLEKMRATIVKAAPKAEEAMSYGLVGYKLGKPLVYFGGFKKHVGFYAVPTGHEAFKKELSVYKNAKGSVQFPHDQPIPFALITKMVKFRVQENAAKDPASEFPKTSKPAERAFANAGIKKLKDLSKWSKEELLTLDGVGPSIIPTLEQALKKKGLSFKKSN